MKIVEYSIATGNDSRQLVSSVNSLVEAGWQPIGGVAFQYIPTVGSNEPEMILVQAVVKYNQ